MKKNEFSQLKEQTIKALQTQLKKEQKELADLCLDKNMRKLADIKAVSKKKKDMARILTVIGQKQLVEQLESKKERKV